MWYTIIIVGSAVVATVKYWYVMVPLYLAIAALLLVFRIRRGRTIVFARDATKTG